MKEENDITSGGGGDVENSIPVEQGVTADDNNNNPYETKQSNKKPKVIALSLFLLCAVILSIALGTTLGNNNSTSSTNEVEGTNNGGDTLGEDDEPIVDVIPTSTDENNNEDTTPTIYKAQYLDNNGPIISKVRIIDSSVANGYDSCIDLRDDIENALKHYANNLIVRESKNNYYEKCDPNDPNWGNSYWWGMEDGMAVAFDGAAPVPEMAMAEESTADKAPDSAGDSAALSGEGGIKEDSYETNNQVR